MTQFRQSQGEGTLSSLSGIVLAGGESRRMGRITKALLQVGGVPIVERTVATLTRVFSEVILITNSPSEFEFLGMPMYRDERPGYGALGGLHTGLLKCTARYGFLVACDMPFLNERVVRYMANLATGPEVVVPRINDRLEPMHAIYSKTCISRIERLMDQSDLRILNFYSDVDVLEVPQEDLESIDPELRFIMNINTPADLEEARRQAPLFAKE